MKSLLVLFGGDSPEHIVSVKSALFVILGADITNIALTGLYVSKNGSVGTRSALFDTIEEIYRNNYLETMVSREELNNVSMIDDEGKTILEILDSRVYDVVFPLFHGKNGEDGNIQGLLQFSGIPFIGCDAAGSFVCIDKAITKRLAQSYGIPVVRFADFARYEWERDREACVGRINDTLRFPIFAKPARLGSSIGIARCDTPEKTAEAIDRAFTFDDKIVIEECVEAREYSIGIIGDEDLQTSSIADVGLDPRAFDFEAKYGPDAEPDSIPADLSTTQVASLEETALRTYRALGLNGMARLDYFYKDDVFLLNEVNTIPGLGGHSLFNRMWDTSGIAFCDLLDTLYISAIEQPFLKRKRL